MFLYVCKQTFHISWVDKSQNLKCYNVKPCACHFYAKSKILVDFYIWISISLNSISSSSVFQKLDLSKFIKIWNLKTNDLLPKTIISVYKFFNASFGPIHSTFHHCGSLDLKIFTQSIFFFLHLFICSFLLIEYHSRQNEQMWFPLIFPSININLSE